MDTFAPSATIATNPLLCPWDTPFGLPPFSAVRAEHFAPAFDAALATHRDEVAAIAHATTPPTFDNTLAALDRSGRQLSRVEQLFFNLAASETSDALQAVERDLAPRLADHYSALYLNDALFARIDAVHEARHTLGLNSEQRRLVERVHLDFVVAGARLSAPAKTRLAEINARLATLTTTFAQNVLADEASFQLPLADAGDLAGLPESLIAAAREAAQQRGATGWVITLSRSLIVPFLTHSARRDLREAAYRAWTTRGEHAGAHDNRPVAREILALRNELARLHGYTNYADYALVDRMAGTPAAAHALLSKVWEPAKARARRERAALEAVARAEGMHDEIAPWDWRYYAEKVRKARYDLDDAQIKPYFSLDNMLAAAFDCAEKLFGIRMLPRPDIPAYHPDVKVFEVQDRTGRPVGLFLSDNFARPSKQGGAWMSSYRSQSRIGGVDVLPIIVNNNNFAKAAEGTATLLSADDARTLFHEFGHGLHGLLSSVTYERLSGTNVLRDFVELPSQLYEHWLLEDAVLARHARHHLTGEAIPAELVAKLKAARRFNQGFETVEYTASALVDLALHSSTDAAGEDITTFEATELARLDMPGGIQMRHRPPHFGHIFSSAAYAAGYYVYIWAEVLEADGFGAFREAGDPFDTEVAERLHRFIYASGNTLEPAAAYRAFRGRDAVVEPMLAQRGLVEVGAEAA
jgi:peptidyl-dipeptidase Dcp